MEESNSIIIHLIRLKNIGQLIIVSEKTEGEDFDVATLNGLPWYLLVLQNSALTKNQQGSSTREIGKIGKKLASKNSYLKISKKLENIVRKIIELCNTSIFTCLEHA